MDLLDTSAKAMSVHSDNSRADERNGEDVGLEVSENETLSTYSNTSKGKGSKSDTQETKKILRKDKGVIAIRVAAVIAILLSAVAISLVEYLGLREAEQIEFEHIYEDQAAQIGHALKSELAAKLKAIDSLSVTISSYSENQSVKWPNIVLPDFKFRAATTLRNGGGLSIGLQPLVYKDDLKEWEEFAIQHQEWRAKGLEFQRTYPDALQVIKDKVDANSVQEQANVDNETSQNISQYIFRVIDGVPVRVEEDLMMPVWQYSPIDSGMPYVNYDQYGKDRNRDALTEVVEKEVAILGPYFQLSESFYGHDFDPVSAKYEQYTWNEIWSGEAQVDATNAADLKINPHSNMDGPAVNLWYPIYSELAAANRTEVGILSMTARWDSFFLPHLPPNPVGLIVVMTNTCSKGFTFDISGDQVTYLGTGDFHDPGFDSYRREFTLTAQASVFSHIPLSETFCPYRAAVYPSQEMRDYYETTRPVKYTLGVGGVFAFTIFVFLLYDYLVERRQRFLTYHAEKTHAIVATMFPEIVRDRLFDTNGSSSRNDIQKFVSQSGGEDLTGPTKPDDNPIADLFTNATVMFGDIAGFTAWSSTRQPTDVFVLLETLYGEFDRIAREMNVFKVETIGDCYVAVTGLPVPQHDHHLRMIRFARQTLIRMSVLTRELEVRLGPDTTMLGFRVGLNSGPVTAGVLRGERARFQLFGDTVNTASRMESTGASNRIQISQATADLVFDSGKGHWLRKRDDLIDAKGKGHVQTYWVKGKTPSSGRTGGSDPSHDSGSQNFEARNKARDRARNERGRRSLIDWQVELLSKLIKQIVVLRKNTSTKKKKNQYFAKHHPVEKGMLPRDEIAVHISMPPFDPKKAKKILIGGEDLPDLVLSQLKDLLSTISKLYHNNSFHNFDHASHVTMSANKLLQRIVTPASQEDGEFLKEAHEYTFGLTSDPLTQFAIVFSTIIHDLDHCGVANGQLVKENSRLSSIYGGKSVAEQNSIDLALELLTSSSYSELLSCICADEEEFRRLRQLIINCVMATDIFDKELLTLRNNRWQKAFSGNDDKDSSDLKATIVIEHIIQAADVAHTMQHWHVYQKWNEKLFFEMRKAYECGRGGEKDPAITWYNGELWFFDNYVIPLAKKLDDCGVFGVCSDECLAYAKQNRKEWEMKGRQVVESMCKKYREFEIKEEESEEMKDESE